MQTGKVYIQASLCLTKLHFYYKQASLLACLVFLFASVKAQNYIPNHSFENVIQNENNIDNIPGYTTDWLTIKTSDWYHNNNVGTQNLWTCADSICAGVPKNIAGFQYPKTGLGYAGFILYDKYNNNGSCEFIKTQLNDTMITSQAYCISLNLALAQISRYAMSKVGAYFTKNQYIPPLPPAAFYWQFNVTPQALNNGTFITDTLNWTKIEMSFVADSAYRWITIGSFADTLTSDSIRISNAPGGIQMAYYYIDDIFLTPLDEPANAALTDTLVATENTAIQLGNNTNTNASYLWWPADNISDVNSPSPNLYVTQSGWHYVQKTQCSYVTYDSVYVKANPVGMNEYDVSSNLYSLQPNPNNGEFVLQNKLNKTITGTLFIYDAQGALVEEIPLKEQNTIRVKLNNCKGIYFLRLVDENNATVYLGKTLVE